MKKLIGTALCAVMMCTSVFAGDISVTLDGENISFSNQEPVISEGRTLIPLRGVFEKLGYAISWDNETKTAELTKDQTSVKVSANASQFSVNDKSVDLDVPAQIINGSMMLPLRAVGEATGLSVSWNSETKTVELSSNESKLGDEDTVFKFDGETGRAVVKPKTEIETATEDTTEAVTEAPVKKGEKLSFTADEKSKAEDYITFHRTYYFCLYYLQSAAAYTEEMNSYNPRKESDKKKAVECLKKIIEFNDNAKIYISELKGNMYTNGMINKIKNYANTSDTLNKLLLERYESDVENVYNENVNNKVKNYNTAMKECSEEMENSSVKYFSDADWMWDYDELTDEELIEVDEYEKSVGEILEKYFSASALNGEDIKKLAEGAKKVSEEVAYLDTPERYRIYAQALILASDLVEESVKIRNENEDDENAVYATSLMITYDYCAVNCAENYYVSYWFD